MHISTLRRLLKDHEDYLLSNHLLDGNHNDTDDVKEYLQLKEHLQQFSEKNSDSTTTTEYQLPENLSFSSHSKLGIAINDLLDLEIFTVVSRPELIDDGFTSILETIQRLPYVKKLFLHRLFCDNSPEAIHLNNTIIDVIVYTAENPSLINDKLLSLEKAIRLLSEYNLLSGENTSLILVSFAAERGNTNSFFEILTLLHNANSLSEKTLNQLFYFHKNYDGIINILKKLSSAGVMINHYLTNTILDFSLGLSQRNRLNNALAQLDFILNILSTKPEIALSTNDCCYLFGVQCNRDQFIKKLSLLNEMSVLNQASFRECLFDRHPILEDRLELLSSIKNLISDKSDIQLDIPFWRYFTSTGIDHSRLLNCLNLLNSNHFLNKNAFDLCLEAVTSTKQFSLHLGDLIQLFRNSDNAQKYNIWLYNLTGLHSDALLNTVSLIQKNHILITNENYLSMLALSNRGAIQLYKIVSNLNQSALISNQSFQFALERVSAKLPIFEESAVTKLSRKITGDKHSHIAATDGQFSFFCDHSKNYAKGSFGVVKKGFSSNDATEAVYSVKRSSHGEAHEGFREISRDAKCNKLLGRAAFYFYVSKSIFLCDYLILSTWHQGQQLDKYTAAELTTATRKSLLQCIIDVFTDVNSLHLQNIVHGDIKPSNVILDLKSSSMKLIDFGGSRKFGSRKKCTHTVLYMDPHTEKYNNHFQRDIYAMGVIVMTLFPALYGCEPIKDKEFTNLDDFYKTKAFYQTHHVIKTTTLTVIERAIVQLVDCLMNADVHARCNSEDALNYCRELLTNLNKLDDALLEKISKSTIHRSQVTVEDAIRDSIRPA